MSDLQIALAVAVRHLDAATTTEKEREAVLSSVIEHFDGEPGETAARSLFHLREQRKLQFELELIIRRKREKNS